jgi:hypothetical protein
MVIRYPSNARNVPTETFAEDFDQDLGRGWVIR